MPPPWRSSLRREPRCARSPSYAPLPWCGDARDEHHDRRQPEQCESCLTHVRLLDRRSIRVLRVRRPLPQYVGRYRGRTLGCTGGEPSAFLQGEVKDTEPRVSGSAIVNASLDCCSSATNAEGDPPSPTASIANRAAEANEPCGLSLRGPWRRELLISCDGAAYQVAPAIWRVAALSRFQRLTLAMASTSAANCSSS